MYELAGTYKLLVEKCRGRDPANTDALIIAAGSSPLVPPIPGLDGDNVVVVNNYYREKDKVGDDVVVFGGGLAGCECAIHLGMEGKRVHLVEMRDVLAPDANMFVISYLCNHCGWLHEESIKNKGGGRPLSLIIACLFIFVCQNT